MARMLELVLVMVGLGVAIAIALAVWFVRATDKERRTQLADPSVALDEAFDGSDDVVVHASRASLPLELWLSGARERGYRLTHQSEADSLGTRTLTFEKVATT